MRHLKFWKKKKQFDIIKLYKVVDINQAKTFQCKEVFRACTEFFKDCTDEYPNHYSLNYSNKSWKTLQGFEKKLRKHDNIDLVWLYASYSPEWDSFYENHFSIGNAMMNSREPPYTSYIDIIITIEKGKLSSNKLYQFLESLTGGFKFDYGYVVSLREGFSANNERKDKVGLFGLESTVEEIDLRWSNNVCGVKEGYIRNIYNLNFLNASHLEQAIIKELMIDDVGTTSKLDGNITIWELTDEELKRAKSKLDASPYVIANNKNPNLFLSTEDAKRFKQAMTID